MRPLSPLPALVWLAWSIGLRWELARAAGSPGTIAWGDVELSPTDEFGNQQRIQQMLFQRFYFSGEMDTEWAKIEGDLVALKELALSTLPAIAVGVANGLYHFFFFQEEAAGAAAVMRADAMLDALRLFNASLAYAGCLDPEREFRDVLLGMCTVKFAFVQLLASELGSLLAARRAVAAAGAVLSQAAAIFRAMRRLPYYAGGFGWTEPREMAFNHELYPNHYGPVWPKEQVPLALFLEEHFATFRADLDAILSDRGLFDHLHGLERNAEGLSVWPPGRRSHIELADLREEPSWKGELCRFAAATCALLQQRPEIAECPRAAVMVARLSPGAWLKPHFGNSRRLVAHLGLEVPEGPISMSVGPARGLRWQRGRALIFDDTHVHDARHDGQEGDRYILHMMMCHPCEQLHLYPHLPKEACEFRDPLRAEISRALRAEMDEKEAQARLAQRMLIPRSAPADV